MSDSHHPGSSEPPAKRVCVKDEEARNEPEISADNATPEKTILVWLDSDCMRMVLDYLPIDDILRSVTVNKQWRAAILNYLRGSQFCFEFYHMPRTHFVPRLLGLVDVVDAHNRRTLPFKMCQGNAIQFQERLRELGPGVASVMLDGLDDKTLKAIILNCPNLKDLMLVGMQGSHIVRERDPQGPEGHMRPQKVLLQFDMLSFSEEIRQCLQQLQLKRLAFIHSPKITEDYICEFLKSNSVEELTICRNKSVDGHCLNHTSTNIKTLRLIGCNLKSVYLTSIADRLANLTMLELSNNPLEILQDVHLVLAKTPNLEHLVLNNYAQTHMGNEFLAGLGGLRSLQRLSLCWNDNVSDEWLAAAASCPSLRSVDIEAGNYLLPLPRAAVTSQGVLALCRGAGRTLAQLGLAGRAGLAPHLAAVVGCCPELQSLDLRGCAGVTPALLTAAAAARGAERARPLRLRLARTHISDLRLQKPEGLILDYVDAPGLFRLV